MKIIKFKKMAGSKYKVFFDNGKNILLHENIIIKYNLLITKKIEEDYDDIIKDNNNYMIYDMNYDSWYSFLRILQVPHSGMIAFSNVCNVWTVTL